MAYNAVPTVATGDPWTAANHNTYIRDNFAAGVPDIFTTAGDLAYASGANAASRLGVGSNGQVLTVNSGLPAWQSIVLKTGKAYRSTNQSLPNNTTTTIEFTTEEIDTGSFFSLGTSNTRLTISEAGTYLTVGSVRFDLYNGTKQVQIYRDGLALSERADIYPENGRGMQVTVLQDATAGQYFELKALQASGSSMNVVFASLVVVKVG